MQNIIRINPVVHKRINAWAKNLKENNMCPVATIAVDSTQSIQVFFDYEEYPAEEIHYILEAALELLEEEINQHSFTVPRYDIH